MVFSAKGMILASGLMIMTIYLFIAAKEDAKSFQVTRWKHLLGLLADVVLLIIFMKERSILEFAIMISFMVSALVAARIKIYGLADGFAIANMLLFFGSISGIIGIGLVILILILACFSAMAKIIFGKNTTLKKLGEKNI